MAAKPKVIRVHFIDSSTKSVALDINATAQDLKQIVIDKIGLKEDACFALFEKKDDWERCIDPDEKPADLLDSWEKNEGKRSKEESPYQFVFKKKIFLKDDDRELEDLVAKDLVYKQALYNVISSDYPCSVEDAIKLAALQLQIVYGDHNPTIHTQNFLTNNISLKNFIPKALYPLKKPAEWEAALLKAHSTNTGKSHEEAKTEYINTVKTWPYYGTTFYGSCKSQNNRGIPSKVIIGINYEGIRLLKPKTKELISEHLFTEICSWASSQTTFAFEFGTQNDSQRYTFETKQGSIIASTIQTYIDILVQMLKNGDDDEEGSETCTISSDTDNNQK